MLQKKVCRGGKQKEENNSVMMMIMVAGAYCSGREKRGDLGRRKRDTTTYFYETLEPSLNAVHCCK